MGEVALLKGYPNPRQKEFFLAKARHIAYGGSRGGGKSWSMRRKFVLLALNYDGLKLLLLRRTYPELRENHILPLQAELHGIAKYKETEKSFIFPNGSRIKCGYCDTEADVFQYQGQEFDVIGFEECTNFLESQVTFITTCNRSTRNDFKPRCYYTANPGGVGHAWFKRLFIDREYVNKEKPEDYIFIPARVYDNKVLMENNPEYITILENLPEDLRRAHLEGDWDVFMGQYFREFRRERHVCEPFEIPKDWKRFRSMDWGYNDPLCCLWYAVSPDSRIYVYRELYINQTLASDAALKIKELSQGEEIGYTATSPDAWAKRGVASIHGESIADDFRGNGVNVVKADNDRINGWTRVREYLKDAPDGVPHLQIFSNCTNLIRTFPAAIHDEHKVEDVGLCEDHALESLRYGLMSRPRPNEKALPKVPKDLPEDLKKDLQESPEALAHWLATH